MQRSQCLEQFSEDQQLAINELFLALPPAEFKVVFLRFWGVFSIADIARELRIDWHSADGILNRALNMLRNSCLRHAAFLNLGEPEWLNPDQYQFNGNVISKEYLCN